MKRRRLDFGRINSAALVALPVTTATDCASAVGSAARIEKARARANGCGPIAGTIAKALGGRKATGSWMARCPAHDDRNPSLSIRDTDDGKVLVRCHAGCDQERVIAALRWRGLWGKNGDRQFTRVRPRIPANDRPERDDTKRRDAALAIWQASTPAAGGTLVETYLVSRGLHLPPPPTLRFHAGLNSSSARRSRSRV